MLTLNGTRCICPCRMGVTNDVEHYLLRCPDRSASRRAELPSPRDRAGMTVQQIIRKWPEKVLAFLLSGGFFEEPLALCRNYTECAYSKEEEQQQCSSFPQLCRWYLVDSYKNEQRLSRSAVEYEMQTPVERGSQTTGCASEHETARISALDVICKSRSPSMYCVMHSSTARVCRFG